MSYVFPVAYRDLAAALERIEQLESELAALKRPRVDWFIVAVRVLAAVGPRR
jgi:uncharacterized protein (UPF0335 family)